MSTKKDANRNRPRFRYEPNRNYATIDLAVVRDERLDLRARGLWITILGMGTEEVTPETLTAASGASDSDIQKALSKLEECGYVTIGNR